MVLAVDEALGKVMKDLVGWTLTTGNQAVQWDGVGEIDRGFAMPYFGKRFSIDPLTSPNAIMRRAKPLTRREQWNRQHIKESLTPIPKLENSLGQKL